MGAMNQTNIGVVKFFNESKNYGFIIDDNDINEKNVKVEYFFHVANTLDRIQKDDNVLYDLENGKRGLKAINVKRVKK